MSDTVTSESAAKSGILAGVFLTVIEVTGGLLSGSLGLLSSSVNTLLDSVALVITFFAVKVGTKPPDEVHMYGHEKIESAAAIGEVLLLLGACSWIVWNAFQRLVTGWQGIEFFWLALGTNFASILVDAFAYLRLKSSSKERRSDAVEVGALHFLTDLLIAAIAIFGLIFYWFGIWYADSIAALGIVVYVVYQGVGAVKESFAALTDAAPSGISATVREGILAVDGVESCHHLRVRRAGPKFFVDAHVRLAGGMPLYQAHSVASRIEDRIADVLPGSDILIHTEPYVGGDPVTSIRNIASEMSEIKGIHGIAVKTIGEQLSVSYHIELEPELSVATAHESASLLEQRIKQELTNVSTIISHLEPTSKVSESEFSGESARILDREIARIFSDFTQVRSFHDVEILTRNGRKNVTLHCTIDGSVSLAQAHGIATKIEGRIKMVDERIDQVSVHCEPETSS